jgi:hypothetical protein
VQRIFKFSSILWVLGGAVLALVLASAITVAIQQHSDRTLEAEIERSAARLQDLGDQIAEIKDAHLVSMNDYIGAYAQIVPLETEYDIQLARIRVLYSRAQARSQKTINLRHFRTAYHPQVWENMAEILDITTQISSIIKREASVIHEMTSLRETERLRYWHEQFLPLEAQERALRERLRMVGERMSPEPQSQ